MNCRILHETRGRMRVRMSVKRMTGAQADRLHYYLLSQEGVVKVTVSERTTDATILFDPETEGVRDTLVAALADFDFTRSQVDVPDHTGRELNRTFEDKLFFLVARRAACMFVLPPVIRNLVCLTRAVHYFGSALKCLQKGKLEVPVLDATTISVSILRGNWSTAGSVMFLLDAGALLEEWTHKRSVDDLARRMYINIDNAWVKTEKDGEVLIPVSRIEPGDHVIVRTGNVIPLDGIVIAGEIADITVSADDLRELIVLRRISNRLMDRIDNNYRRIMLFNGGLIALGLFGIIPPASSALYHNISTIYFSLDSMKNLL